MAEYKHVDCKELDVAIVVLSWLETAKDGRSANARWCQSLLDELVKRGYVVPTVVWRVRDTKYGRFEGPDYATKAEALDHRRRSGGNSARYRVESVRIAPPEEL